MRKVAIGVGACVMLAGAVLLATPYLDAAHWQSSPEAAVAVRNAAAPTLIVLTPTPPKAIAIARPAPTPAPTMPDGQLTPVPALALSTPVTLQAEIAVAPSPTPVPPSDLELGASSFVFDDPPEPGAHVRLSLTIHNPTSEARQSVLLSLPQTWLAGYRLETVDPTAQSGGQADGALKLTFVGPPPQGDLDVSLDFVTTDEVIDSPNFTVFDGENRKIGSAHPGTQAPQPRPGPIYSIDIPRLKLHSAVVPVDWEPPLFVVGQLRASAFVTQGNSVLVGHVRGAAGYNVFDHLDQLEIGDEVVANSRGADYHFVVTDRQTLPEDDTSPTDATLASRLTLMTCAGEWNPITRDYADRLWVVAEPKDAPTPARGVD